MPVIFGKSRHLVIAIILLIVAAIVISHGSAQLFNFLRPVSSPPIAPNPVLTPGATLAVGKADVCTEGYTEAVRDVPISVKRQVYAEYGVTHHEHGEYEVDHLISLELGGSNSIKNLWPESYRTNPWNARVKDQLENHLNDLVCSGQIDLPTAQHAIATDWIGAYKQYFHTLLPLTSAQARAFGRSYSRHTSGYGDRPDTTPELSTPPADTAPAIDIADMVWVNTRSKKYFHADSIYYGKTKEGKYMSESDAITAGDVAAKQPKSFSNVQQP